MCCNKGDQWRSWLYVCLSVCPCFKSKEASAMDTTKPGRRILCRTSACIDLRTKGQRTIWQGYDCCWKARRPVHLDLLLIIIVVVVTWKAFMIRWRAEHRSALSAMRTRRYRAPSPCNNRRPDVCAICLEEFSVKQVRLFLVSFLDLSRRSYISFFRCCAFCTQEKHSGRVFRSFSFRWCLNEQHWGFCRCHCGSGRNVWL